METASSDNEKERNALRAAVETNRMQMQRAWVKAEGLNGALQSAKETHDKIKDGMPNKTESD